MSSTGKLMAQQTFWQGKELSSLQMNTFLFLLINPPLEACNNLPKDMIGVATPRTIVVIDSYHGGRWYSIPTYLAHLAT